MIDDISFMVTLGFSVYLFIIGCIIGFKGQLNLIYSINQVKILQYDDNKRLKISRYIASVYIITSIGLLITALKDFIIRI